MNKLSILQKIIIIPVFLIGCYSSAIAQSNSSDRKLDTCQLKVIAQVNIDNIVLRWAPNNAAAWQEQLHNGYVIERFEIPEDTSKPLILLRLTSVPQVPLSKEAWIKKFGASNNLAIAAGSQIYPEIEAESNLNVVSIIQGNNKLITRHGFALFAADNDPQIADAEGLRYADTEIKKNTKYLYKVHFAVSIPTVFCDTAYVYVNSAEPTVMPLASVPTLASLESKIELRWDAGITSGFSAFHIERALSGTSEFKRLNKNPFISFHEAGTLKNDAYYSDSIPNYVSYDYRIIGITAFGEQSKPSKIVKGMARDFTPPATAVITGVASEGKTALKISWKLPRIDADLKSVEISRSYEIDGSFMPISADLAISNGSYIDENPEPHRGNFYIVICRDTAGNVSKSLPFYGIVDDDTPPEIPVGLSGYIDTASIVHLQWKMGLEPDLQGYRVYVSNSTDHEFSNITPDIVADTLFLDTIVKRTLSKFIYYKIVAVDNNYNHSDYSSWIKVRRLDVIPPVAPVFGKIEVTDSTVNLNWINSSSDDVKEQVLFRKPAEDSVWMELRRWKSLENCVSFTDKHLPKKQFFEYLLMAIDSSNLESDSSSLVSIRTYDSGIREAIVDLSVKYDKEKKSTELSWKYNHTGNFSFLIYRALPEKPFTKYKMTNGNDHSFEDSSISLSGEYSYAIKVIYVDGGESPLSEKKTVLIK